MKSKGALALTLGLLLACSAGIVRQSACSAAVSSPSTPADGAVPDEWWKHAIFYEVYPRSFADGKNTGMGNLCGITAKLDYLKDLGIDAIWITPCFPSPQVDFGYDISDYCQIAPEYGTMQDFDTLVAEAKKRDIKIILDLVLNHTSDKHPWFVESASSKTSPKRDWYIWKDPKSDGTPPNNWQSLFGHSAWKLDPKTNQFYYHFFYAEQPDLNWRNPEVRKAMHDVARFWLDRGVAGFRLDAVQTLFEDPMLTNNPVKASQTNQYGDPAMDHKYNHKLAQVHDALKELRQVVDSYPDHRVLIGETSADDHSQLAQMYGKNLDEVQLPMNFFFADVNELSAEKFRKEIQAADNNSAGGWPVYLFSNHDQQRHFNRYGDGKHNDEIAKLLAAMLLTLRGTPLMYYGEEIGMENNDPKKVEDVKDPIGKIGWPREKGRDGERTPMQWTPGTNAGFSQSTPWLPVSNNYATHNVQTEESDPNSILNFYKSLIHLRRTNDALKNGKYVALNQSDPKVLAYARTGTEKTVVVALNMSSEPTRFSFNLSDHDWARKTIKPLINTASSDKAGSVGKQLQLEPFGVFIGELL